MHISVDTPEWALWEKGWLKHYKTMVSPFLGCFSLGKQKNNILFGRFFCGFFHIGRARHPGPGPRVFTPGELSIEFAQYWWLVDLLVILALDSCAPFLAVAEHRLIPSRARSMLVTNFSRAGFHSVCAPACQESDCWWSCWGWGC